MNNLKLKISNKMLTGLLLLIASSCACSAEPIAGTSVIPLKSVVFKFAISMGSVLISLIVIWVLLNIYKNYARNIQNNNGKTDLYGDTLESPKNVDDAIISFIDKNRL